MSHSAEARTPIVEVENLIKTYGAIQALKGISLKFYPGEIHGLVGANGAGKSTLVRSLAGLEHPDSGEILVHGVPTVVQNPSAASKLKFAFIHQELNLVKTFTAAQNIMLGSNSPENKILGNFRRVPPVVKKVAQRIGITFPLDKIAGELSVHQQWLVSIARALVNESELIVMDEPTGSLDAEESSRLLQVCKDLASEGVAVVFISHRLDEVIEICGRATVFRDGAVSAHLGRSDLTRERLIMGIVGRAVAPGEGRGSQDFSKNRIALDVQGLTRGRSVKGASLQLREGEMLGIAGLVGAGRTELARMIFGADQPDAGSMTLFGQSYAPRSVSDGMAHAVAYVPEERRAEALFLHLSISSNLHAASWQRRSSWRMPWVSQRRTVQDAQKICQDLGVVMRADGAKQPISALSGGNQQKVVIGRWLQTAPRILVLDEPTRGVDVGARADIYSRIREIVATGMSVIVISSEFEELLECDRVAVMSSGTIVGDLVADNVTVSNMLALCYA